MANRLETLEAGFGRRVDAAEPIGGQQQVVEAAVLLALYLYGAILRGVI